MSLKKYFVPRIVGILFCFLITIWVLSMLSQNESIWFANVFLDKVYVFEIAPLCLIGVAHIDRLMTIPAYIRIGSREKALFISLGFKCGFVFMYTCVWFIIVNIITSVKFTYIYERNLLDIIDIFFRYLLGLIILSIIAEIFNRSNNKVLSNNSYICAILFLALEVTAIVPEIRINTRYNPSFVFSWVFYEGIEGYIALAIIILLLMVCLLRINKKKDIL